jgi:hypothetical protein
MNAVVFAIALLGADLSTVAPEAHAMGGPRFRVESQIFVGGDVKPQQRNVTIFDQHLAIDYNPDQSGPIHLYDFEESRITRLNLVERQRSSIKFSDLDQLLQELRRGLSDKQAKQVGLDIEPQELPKGNWIASAPAVVYQMSGQPEPIAGSARRYAAFANYAIRMNLFNGSKTPPFLRMRLNEVAASKSMIPATVTIANKQITAVYQVSPELTAPDQQLFLTAREQGNTYTEIPWK